jgi:uncharacterized protein (DUF488 family)
MLTAGFQDALARLIDAARSRPAAIMCAEASWHSCHRALLSDALKAQGWEVVHIVDQRRIEPHPFTPVARLVNGRLTYASQSQQTSPDLG